MEKFQITKILTSKLWAKSKKLQIISTVITNNHIPSTTGGKIFNFIPIKKRKNKHIVV